MKNHRKYYQKLWYKKNRERILLAKQLDYAENTEKYRTKNKKNYKKFKEKYLKNRKQDRKKNPAKYKNYDLKKKFNISLKEYNEKLKQQKHRCSLCKRHKSNFKKALAVDHCHETGKVRGLLCDKCNVGLGSFYENIKTLESAIKYLKEHYVS